MPDVSLKNRTFERLQSLTTLPVDMNDTVINRALDALEQNASPANDETPDGTAQEWRIYFRQLPPLTHTKVLDASIAGKRIAQPNWKVLRDELLRRAMKRVGTFDKLQELCPVNMVSGRKEDKGHDYLSDIEISVQGQDANGAGCAVVTVALALGVALEVGFKWHDTDKAAHPGQKARILIADTASKIAMA